MPVGDPGGNFGGTGGYGGNFPGAGGASNQSNSGGYGGTGGWGGGAGFSGAGGVGFGPGGNYTSGLTGNYPALDARAFNMGIPGSVPGGQSGGIGSAIARMLGNRGGMNIRNATIGQLNSIAAQMFANRQMAQNNARNTQIHSNRRRTQQSTLPGTWQTGVTPVVNPPPQSLPQLPRGDDWGYPSSDIFNGFRPVTGLTRGGLPDNQSIGDQLGGYPGFGGNSTRGGSFGPQYGG